MKNLPLINLKDAQILEDWEQTELKHQRTRHAIQKTYNSSWVSKDGRTSSRPFTKKRRKLGGKRRWKNKDTQYKSLEGNMAVVGFNKRQEANKAIERIRKRNLKRMLPED